MGVHCVYYFHQVRVFTYAVGPTPNPISAVKWMACSNRGVTFFNFNILILM